MFRVICLILGYAFGCIQSAFIIAKCSNNIDIRKYGSGNAGTTNVVRVLGWKYGFMTFFGDFIKASIAVILCKLIFKEQALVAGLFAGLGVVMGHNYPFYMHFKGGKGIASTFGTMLGIDWRIGLICASIVIIIILTTKYMSLGSLLMSIAIPILIYLFYKDNPMIVQMVVISFLFTISAFYKHKANIKRLLNGTESKVGHKKNKNMEDEK